MEQKHLMAACLTLCLLLLPMLLLTDLPNGLAENKTRQHQKLESTSGRVWPLSVPLVRSQVFELFDREDALRRTCDELTDRIQTGCYSSGTVDITSAFVFLGLKF